MDTPSATIRTYHDTANLAHFNFFLIFKFREFTVIIIVLFTISHALLVLCWSDGRRWHSKFPKKAENLVNGIFQPPPPNPGTMAENSTPTGDIKRIPLSRMLGIFNIARMFGSRNNHKDALNASFGTGEDARLSQRRGQQALQCSLGHKWSNSSNFHVLERRYHVYVQ